MILAGLKSDKKYPPARFFEILLKWLSLSWIIERILYEVIKWAVIKQTQHPKFNFSPKTYIKPILQKIKNKMKKIFNRLPRLFILKLNLKYCLQGYWKTHWIDSENFPRKVIHCFLPKWWTTVSYTHLTLPTILRV